MLGLLAISAGTGAHAQETPAARAPAAATSTPATEDSAPVSDVIVTGSRIARTGYDTPTPVTVIGADDIKSSGEPNLADFLNQLPAVVGSTTPANSNRALSNGAAGINSINLRSLGNSRTLVLLDGHRSVASTPDGVVDINTFPQALVKSIEIVTGGASATYGSDAVSGVVNFLLDKEFTGVKVDVQGGETTYGDDPNWTGSITGGMAFADGKGHLLLNEESARDAGIYGMGNRTWAGQGFYMVNNAAFQAGNGAPEYFVTGHAGQSVMTPGGIITSTALRGTYFGNGGVVNHFAYGATRDPWTVGGDWQLGQSNSRTSLDPQDDRDGLFGRLSWIFTDQVSGYFQASWNQDRAQQWGGTQSDKGSIPIRADNAFLPASVALQAQQLGITQFNLGTSNADIPTRVSDNYRTVQRYTAGLEGSFTLGTEFKWDAAWQEGITKTHELLYASNNARLALAQDAVVNPATGAIVCRSTLTNPGNGCVPFDRMGIGVNSQAAVDYIMGYPQREQRLQQDVGALNFRTQIANPWLKPIGLAFGYEHRKEEISGNVDPQYENGWIVGNFLPTFGSYNVNEGYVEVLATLPGGFEIDGAARATDYSTSGFVTTWKAGLTWSPVDDVRLRSTFSRDIRAPNLQDLFQAGQRNTNFVTDPFYSNASTRYTQSTVGNLELKPETADTTDVGVVFTPSFATGLALSVDYYDIRIKDAIQSVTPQDIIDRCYLGIQSFCAAFTRDPTSNSGHDLYITNSPFNFVEQRARGLDVESSYKFKLSSIASTLPGSVMLHALATHYISLQSNDGEAPTTDVAGQNTLGGPPHWIYRLTSLYNIDRMTFSLTGRGLSAGTYSNAYVQCTAGCPASTTYHRTINDNHIPGAFYVDAYMAYDLDVTTRTTGQVFLKVNNLANRDPVPVGLGPGDSSNVEPGINRTLYDYLGRTFMLGFRVKWGP